MGGVLSSKAGPATGGTAVGPATTSDSAAMQVGVPDGTDWSAHVPWVPIAERQLPAPPQPLPAHISILTPRAE